MNSIVLIPYFFVKKTAKKKSSNYTLPIALVVILLGLTTYIVLNPDVRKSLMGPTSDTENEDVAVEGSPTPRPSPRALPQGPQVYSLSHGSSVKGPKPSEVRVDPFDPKAGQKQTATIKIKHTNPVTSVTARLETDNKKQSYTFNRIAGTDTDGTWEASWNTEDTHDYNYYLYFELASADGAFKGGLTFR